MIFRSSMLVAGLLASSAGAGATQDLIAWGDTEYWSVFIDPTLGNGCLIQSEFDDGSVVRIGLDRTTGFGYVTAFNEGWGAIEDGKVYPVDFTLDGEEYSGEAKGIYLDDVPGADIEFDNADFFNSIATRKTMTMIHEGTEVLSIELAGSLAGLEAVAQCQDEQG